RIMDLALNMIRLSGKEPGRDVRVEVTGIRPGEKLGEELFNVDETVTSTRYGKIRRATRPPLEPGALDDGLRRIARLVADADVGGAERALWATRRAGRAAPVDGESPVSAPFVQEDRS